MPRPQYAQESLDSTSYYHCISRCVGRAFLCGVDITTGNSFEHRRQWIEDKLLELAQIFCIDLCSFVVMSNHYHVVLHTHKDHAQSLSNLKVIERGHQLFKGSLLSQRHQRNEALTKTEVSH